MDDLQPRLDTFKVPSTEQAELRAIVHSTYRTSLLLGHNPFTLGRCPIACCNPGET